MKRYKSAQEDFKIALELTQGNREIRKEYESLKLLLESTAKVKIYPVIKETQFQSLLPLKEIQIQDDNLTQTGDCHRDIDTDLVNSIKNLVTSRTPKGYSQFEYDWRNLSTCEMSDKVKYLEHINNSALENIFKFPFEPKMLFEVLQTLSHSANQVFKFQVLNLISTMPRFSINVCFFEDEEFASKLSIYIYVQFYYFFALVLGIIFRDLLKSDQMNKEQVVSLAKTFNVKIDQ